MIRIHILNGIDPATAPDGTIYDVVSAPNAFKPRWRKVRFMVVIRHHPDPRLDGRWHRVIMQRDLEPDEIAEYEGLL